MEPINRTTASMASWKTPMGTDWQNLKMSVVAGFLHSGRWEQTWNSKDVTLWLRATVSTKLTILCSRSGSSSSGQMIWTLSAPISARRSWMSNGQFFVFVFLLRCVGGEVMLGAGRFPLPVGSAPRPVSRIAVKSLLRLNAWAKHQSYRSWVPGTERQGMSSLKPQNSRIEETNISAKGMTDTAGQYFKKSRAACKLHNSRQ